MFSVSLLPGTDDNVLHRIVQVVFFDKDSIGRIPVLVLLSLSDGGYRHLCRSQMRSSLADFLPCPVPRGKIITVFSV